MRTYSICTHYKRCIRKRKEEKELHERMVRATLAVIRRCLRFFKRFNYENRMKAWVKGSVLFLHQFEQDRRQDQAKGLMVKFIAGHNFQKVFLKRMKRLINAVRVIQNHWKTHRAELKSLSDIIKR